MGCEGSAGRARGVGCERGRRPKREGENEKIKGESLLAWQPSGRASHPKTSNDRLGRRESVGMLAACGTDHQRRRATSGAQRGSAIDNYNDGHYNDGHYNDNGKKMFFFLFFFEAGAGGPHVRKIGQR